MGLVRDDFQVVYQVGQGVHIDRFDQLLEKSGLQTIDFLNTSTGVDLVEQTLQQIAHGYVV